MNNRPYTLVILSAIRPEMTKEGGERATHTLLKLLSPLPCTVGTGLWEGVEESTVITQVTTPEDLSFVIYCAKHFNQEAVLVVDTQDQARLVYCDGRPGGEELGTWTEVQSVEGLSAWTKVGTRYFTTKKPLLYGIPHSIPLVDVPPVKHSHVSLANRIADALEDANSFGLAYGEEERAIIQGVLDEILPSIPLANEDDAVYAMYGMDDGPRSDHVGPVWGQEEDGQP